MGIFYSSLQCPQGECYRQIPMMAYQKLFEDPSKMTDLKSVLMKYHEGDQERVLRTQDIVEIMKCLGISPEEFKKGIETGNMEAHQHTLEQVSCCDPVFVESAMAGVLARDRGKGMAMIKPKYENHQFAGYEICDPQKPEDGCEYLSATAFCQLGMNDALLGGFIPANKLTPLCGAHCAEPPAITLEAELMVSPQEHQSMSQTYQSPSTTVSPSVPQIQPVSQPGGYAHLSPVEVGPAMSHPSLEVQPPSSILDSSAHSAPITISDPRPLSDPVSVPTVLSSDLAVELPEAESTEDLISQMVSELSPVSPATVPTPVTTASHLTPLSQLSPAIVVPSATASPLTPITPITPATSSPEEEASKPLPEENSYRERVVVFVKEHKKMTGFMIVILLLLIVVLFRQAKIFRRMKQMTRSQGAVTPLPPIPSPTPAPKRA